MEIERINTYQDRRFSQRVLNQHGCFLADGEPYEVEIISGHEAVVRGRGAAVFPGIIEEFRFYTPHITVFYDENRNRIKEFPAVPVFQVRLEKIQPSQFYVDGDKLAAIQDFVRTGEDIVIPVMRHDGRYISLDGHTRLYYAVMRGWQAVNAAEDTSGDYIYGFVEEAIRRGIRSPSDLKLVDHAEYEVKWNQFCDNYFGRE